MLDEVIIKKTEKTEEEFKEKFQTFFKKVENKEIKKIDMIERR